MTTNLENRTATILAFPLGGKATLRRQKIAADALAHRPIPVAVGESWYHQEAILEDERDRRN